MPDAERFWRRVDKSGECWLWTGARDTHGYGNFYMQGRYLKASRASWILTNGVEPSGYVCHSCDNPPCVRPDHLFVGSNADNMADMRAKGRSAFGDRQGLRKHPERASKGEGRWSARHTEAEVMEIRRLYAEGITQDELARRFSDRQGNISRIVTGQRWRHLPLIERSPK